MNERPLSFLRHAALTRAVLKRMVFVRIAGDNVIKNGQMCY